MAEERIGDVAFFFDGRECWEREDLVSVASLASLSGDGALRLVDEATGVEFRVVVEGSESARSRFLARGKLGLSVEYVASWKAVEFEGWRLTAVHLDNGGSLVVGAGANEFLYPGSHDGAAEPDSAPGGSDEPTLTFEVEVVRKSIPADGDLLVSWIVDPKLRSGDKHWWSTGGYPTIYVNTGGSLWAAGSKVSYPASRKIRSTGFLVTTAESSIDYEMTGKNLYLNGSPYP